MNILQINTLGKTKSTGRSTYEMHKWLLEHNIDSHVITSIYGRSENQYGQEIYGSIADAKIHSILSRITGLQGYFSVGTTRHILKKIEMYNPDIVILGVLHSNFINLNMLLKYLKRKKIITILILHDLWYITGHCVYPTITSCEKYKEICKNCNQKKLGNKSWFFDTSKLVQKQRKKIYNKWPQLGIVGVSKWVTQQAKESYLASDISKITTIYNWIDQSIFKPINIDKKDKTFIIMSVCVEWNEEKGIMDFLELSNMLKDEKLILVGKISLKYKKMFLNENVKFIDYTDSVEQLNELYNYADVYVSLSRNETFGKTIAEAICCGTPAITYNVTACKELVSDGCGYAVPFKKVDMIYNKIKLIKANGKNKYTKNCIKKARKDFNIDNCMKKYFNLIDQIKISTKEE